MAYSRSAPTFSFSGVDKLNRTVTLFPDMEDRAAQIGRRRRTRASVGGTVSMSHVEFATERPMVRLG